MGTGDTAAAAKWAKDWISTKQVEFWLTGLSNRSAGEALEMLPDGTIQILIRIAS